MTSVCICVVTKQRPDYLGQLLDSLAVLDAPDAGTDVSILVVDNDARQSAAPVVERWRDATGRSCRYATEERAGIPHARNRAVALAGESDFIAFVDDDERPGRRWLVELLRVQRATGADAVMGPVVAEFESAPPVWIRRGGFYGSPRYPDGAWVHYGTTSNVLIARHLFDTPAPFDPSLALAGGEDLRFFRQAISGGARVAWADQAVVRETIPPSRMTAGWIIRRHYRNGINRSADLVHFGATPAQIIKRCGLAAMQTLSGALHLLSAPLRGRAAAVEGLRRVAHAAGLVGGLVGRTSTEYATLHGH